MSSPNNYQNLGAANAAVISSVAQTKVLSVCAHNENASDRWLLLLNQTTTPVNNDVPVEAFILPGGGTLQSIVGTDYFTLDGTEFSVGLAWAFSSTKDVVTLATASDQSVRIKWTL